MIKFIVIFFIIIFNIQIYQTLFNRMFTSKKDFFESMRYILTPDILSLFRGEYKEDLFGEMRFIYFILICVLIGIIEFNILASIFRFLVNNLSILA